VTDIVERLRDAAYVEKNALLCATVAADTIERLRAEIKTLNREITPPAAQQTARPPGMHDMWIAPGGPLP
jgi:hypothetical protein